MQSNWEEAHSNALRELFDKGMTFSEIARALNARFGTAYSRNAVIGRARRMGLTSTERGERVLQASSPKRQHLRRLQAVRAKNLATVVPKPPSRRSTTARAAALQLRCVAVVPRHLALVELESGDCRYPYGGDAEGEPITFCGHPRRQGSSYCTSHFHLTSAPELRERTPTKARLRLVEAA